jgi:hypothetical protein
MGEILGLGLGHDPGPLVTPEADRARLAELRDGTFARRRGREQAQLDDAGQHEFLNWACLARAMDDLGYHPEIVDFVESYVFNSSKCFAVFER